MSTQQEKNNKILQKNMHKGQRMEQLQNSLNSI